jgi:hypothetical protein
VKLRRRLWWIVVQAVVIGWQSHGITEPRPPQDATLGQHFVCNTGYTLEKCHEELSVLRKVVAQYPTEALGEWTWCWCDRRTGRALRAS